MTYAKNEALWFDIALVVFLVLVAFVTIYPFINVVAVSFNDATDTIRGGIHFWPRVPTLQNYRAVFDNPRLIRAALVSVARTVVGAGLGVFSSAMVAYCLKRSDFILRKPMTILFLLTLYFSGGLVPEYLLIVNLGLINRFSVYILPMLLSAWNIIVIRAFMQGLPASLEESAKLDGASDLRIFLEIVLPLCKPVIATVTLFVAVWQWNSWIDTFLYAARNENLSTLQYELMRVLSNTTAMQSPDAFRGQEERISSVTPQSIRAAITIIATVPILTVYPFLQRYFVKGLVLGAVKL